MSDVVDWYRARASRLPRVVENPGRRLNRAANAGTFVYADEPGAEPYDHGFPRVTPRTMTRRYRRILASIRRTAWPSNAHAAKVVARAFGVDELTAVKFLKEAPK